MVIGNMFFQSLRLMKAAKPSARSRLIHNPPPLHKAEPTNPLWPATYILLSLLNIQTKV